MSRSSGREIVADNQVKGFIVENKTTPGFSVEKIENKIALKVVQNGQITLKDVRVPEANRLQGDNSFRDTAKVLQTDTVRRGVGWRPDAQMGAYEAALKYARSACSSESRSARSSWFRIFSPKCSRNITASQCLMVRARRNCKPKAS